MHRPRVLIFSVVDLTLENGGSIWARSLLETLSEIPDIDFTVLSSGRANSNEALVRSLGFDHEFVPFVPSASSPKSTSPLHHLFAWITEVLGILRDKYEFQSERDARRQRHVDDSVVSIVRRANPDLILVNAIRSAHFAPSVFGLSTPCCLITTNNESAFHRTMRSQSVPLGEGMHLAMERWIRTHGNWLPNLRLQNRVNRIYKQCAGLVCLTDSDLPRDLPRHMRRAILPPLLRSNIHQWSYQETRNAFFVGSIAYFPNRLAIEWLCSELAPELLRVDGRVSINIIGATQDQTLRCWRYSNVRFLGRANREAVIQHMIRDDIFVAPIANRFGAKLKIAECISHGMPFLATQAAMSGLPFLPNTPRIELEKPRDAARLIVDYMNRPEALKELGESATREMQSARISQILAWKSFLHSSIQNVPVK